MTLFIFLVSFYSGIRLAIGLIVVVAVLVVAFFVFYGVQELAELRQRIACRVATKAIIKHICNGGSLPTLGETEINKKSLEREEENIKRGLLTVLFIFSVVIAISIFVWRLIPA